MKISFYTLGCKVNQNESAALMAIFADAGHSIAPKNEKADVYIINSCTVTQSATAKSRRALNHALHENPQAITVLTGCFVQAFPKEACALSADITTGTAGRRRILKHIEAFLQTKQKIIDVESYTKYSSFEELAHTTSSAYAHTQRTRCFVKIQDGCNRRCAYCIIPSARGNVRSRSEASILQELEDLAAAGCREVVFTGINLPSYGKDNGTNLAEIVEKSSLISGISRIRLSSLDPDLLNGQMIERFAAAQRLCPQFHLSLQSGSSETLKRMRRPYTAEQYRVCAELLRKKTPNATLTTDVIVGFPGETEAEFEESLNFVISMNFLKVHVFPFSAREGTPAASFENQIPKHIKQERAAKMQKAADEAREKLISSFLGTRQTVLLEQKDKHGFFSGYTANYIPIKINAPLNKQGDIIDIVLTKEMVSADF